MADKDEVIKEIESSIKRLADLASLHEVEFMGFSTSSDDDLDAYGSVNASAKFIARVICNVLQENPLIAEALEQVIDELPEQQIGE